MRAGPFAATMVAAFCVAGMATATAMEPAEIAGRWVSDKEWVQDNHRITLDISRCGTGWCGVEVKNGATCGRTVLRLDEGELREPVAAFSGRIGLASGAQPYGIRVHLSRYEGAFQQRHSPLKRGVTLDEIGGAALYLLSDLSTGVTGDIHFVDSGYNVIAMPQPTSLKDETAANESAIAKDAAQ